MVRIDKCTIGSIVIDGKKHGRDILILADGTVKRRKGGFLMFGSHEIKRHEFEELSRGQPQAIIVGTGTDGAAHVAPEAQRWTAGKSLDLLVQPPHQAVVRLNEASRQRKMVATLIHITC